MIHPASRLEVVVHSRADGRNAVKSAAYTARATYRDARSGRRFRANKAGGLLSHEIINWTGTAEDLWSAAESAETRGNARVLRELRPSLPAELPLAEQIRLVRGFSLWLRDEFGAAIQADIHAPRFLDPSEEKLHQAGKLAASQDDYVAALFDPARTNRNFHAHILMTTRKVSPETGEFGAKTRILDDKKSGPAEILRIRQEWEKRTNAALRRIGSSARVDLRSYKNMARAGDAPAGLIAQNHQGPRRSARSRRLAENGSDISRAGRRRAAVQHHNAAVWQSWLVLRALERERDRLSAAQLAHKREQERKKRAAGESKRLQSAHTIEEAEAAIAGATQFDSLKSGSALAAALRWAREGGNDPYRECCEFSEKIDLEKYEPPRGRPQAEPVLEPQLTRVRGSRSR